MNGRSCFFSFFCCIPLPLPTQTLASARERTCIHTHTHVGTLYIEQLVLYIDRYRVWHIRNVYSVFGRGRWRVDALSSRCTRLFTRLTSRRARVRRPVYYVYRCFRWWVAGAAYRAVVYKCSRPTACRFGMRAYAFSCVRSYVFAHVALGFYAGAVFASLITRFVYVPRHARWQRT